MRKRLQQIIGESGYFGLIKRVTARAGRELRQWRHLAQAKCKGSYHQSDVSYELASCLNFETADLADVNGIPSLVITHYLHHQFDLLGSGWVEVFYGMNCRGLEQYQFEMGKPVKIDSEGNWLKGRINRSNLVYAQKIWQHISPDYQPIDWQLDFKSGYRWSEQQWSKKIRIGHIPGVDIKVPWELARMQHLPQLALAYLSPERCENEKSRILAEYQNQMLDFMATNPPGFGVNWVCPMDVAIRAVNWLLARDIFLSGQIQFKPSVEHLFAKSIYEHGHYIVENLEWSPLRANHYLANITGLAFIAAYLPSSPETDAWLAFATQELVIEVDRQFHPDGGNFEGSTSYHRLSAEMVYYASALILGLPSQRLEKLQTYNHTFIKNKRGTPCLKAAPLPLYPLPDETRFSPFPPDYLQRLERMAEFIIDITKPSGHIPQIGDNDSGRFFKLAPIYRQMTVREAQETYLNLDNYKPCTLSLYETPDDAIYFMEDNLDCRHLVAASAGLFERAEFANWPMLQEGVFANADRLIIRALAKKSMQSQICRRREYSQRSNKDIFETSLLQLLALPEHHCRKFEFTVDDSDLLTDLTLKAYPDFGLFIFQSSRLYLAVRCWIGNEPLHSSHRHHDQLSVELVIDNKNIISDPGTYLYTPIPVERNNYRSSESHFSPFSTSENQDFHLANVFRPIQIEKVEVIYFGDKGFIGKTASLKDLHQLAISLGNNSVVIYHAHKNKELSSKLPNKSVFSSGYGIKYKTWS
ncbi:MAG: heparinase II/III family protein [Legionella sp.]|nr:heparinase II/III family protein [Legionella sp.]